MEPEKELAALRHLKGTFDDMLLKMFIEKCGTVAIRRPNDKKENVSPTVVYHVLTETDKEIAAYLAKSGFIHSEEIIPI